MIEPDGSVSSAQAVADPNDTGLPPGTFPGGAPLSDPAVPLMPDEAVRSPNGSAKLGRLKLARSTAVRHLMRASLGIVFVLGFAGCDPPSPRTTLEPDPAPDALVVARPIARRERPSLETPTRAETPVVVELFSSEGCSSCPPADLVLGELSTKQGIPGANVIALELHVDYWNDLGWADPFSSSDFSARQRGYSRAASRRGAFTPEAIVDGRASVVGSDTGRLTSEVEAAAARAHIDVTLRTRNDGSLEAVSSARPSEASSYWLAITEAGLVTEVKAGENRGQTLRHAPVVRSLERVGSVTLEPTRIELRPSNRRRVSSAPWCSFNTTTISPSSARTRYL